MIQCVRIVCVCVYVFERNDDILRLLYSHAFILIKMLKLINQVCILISSFYLITTSNLIYLTWSEMCIWFRVVWQSWQLVIFQNSFKMYLRWNSLWHWTNQRFNLKKTLKIRVKHMNGALLSLKIHTCVN